MSTKINGHTLTTFLAACIRSDLSDSGLKLETSPKSKIEATIAKTIADVEKRRWPEFVREAKARKNLNQD